MASAPLLVPIYEQHLEPIVARLERRRLLHLRLGVGAIIGLPLAVFIAFGSQLITDAEMLYYGGSAMMVALLAGIWLNNRVRLAWEKRFAALVMPRFLKAFEGMRYHYDGTQDFPLPIIEHAPLFGRFRRAQVRHVVDGRHRGVDYKMALAQLDMRPGELAFHGLVLRIMVPIPSPGVIWIGPGYERRMRQRHKSFWNRVDMMAPVALDHPAVGDVIEVCAENPDAVHAYLPTGFIDILIEISRDEGLGRRAFTAVFDGDTCHLAMDQATSKRFLMSGTIKRSVRDLKRDLPRLESNLTVPHRIIDRLAGVDA